MSGECKMQITTESIILFIILSISYCYISYISGKKKGYTDGYIQGQCDYLVKVVEVMSDNFFIIPKGEIECIKDEEKN